MAVIVSEKNSKRYEFGKDCEGYFLLESPGFNIKFEKIPAGSTTSWHYHRGMTQFFYVRAGTLSMETADKKFILNAGEGIELKGHVKHRVHNDHEQLVEYIVAEKYQDDCTTYYD